MRQDIREKNESGDQAQTPNHLYLPSVRPVRVTPGSFVNDFNESAEYSVAESLLHASFWKTGPEADLREGLAMGEKMPQTSSGRL